MELVLYMQREHDGCMPCALWKTDDDKWLFAVAFDGSDGGVDLYFGAATPVIEEIAEGAWDVDMKEDMPQLACELTLAEIVADPDAAMAMAVL